jgi:hypothetical protein
METRVERVESGLMFSLLFAGARRRSPRRAGRPLKLGLGRSDRYIEVALQIRPGGPMPPGNYTVEIHGSGSRGGTGAVAARKCFVGEG